MPIMAGIGAVTTQEVLPLATDVRQAGVDGALLAPVDYIRHRRHQPADTLRNADRPVPSAVTTSLEREPIGCTAGSSSQQRRHFRVPANTETNSRLQAARAGPAVTAVAAEPSSQLGVSNGGWCC
ncbi:hypothetical protein J7I98_37355 [Streptomyces sp. ISL-98]|nr:hypothetical protein [Streptomyces sp. ISL-98]